jgi:hypothetical protein
MSDRTLFAAAPNMSYNRPPSLILSPTANDASDTPTEPMWRLNPVGRLEPNPHDAPPQSTSLPRAQYVAHTHLQAAQATPRLPHPTSLVARTSQSMASIRGAPPLPQPPRSIKSTICHLAVSSRACTHPCRPISLVAAFLLNGLIRSAVAYLSPTSVVSRIFPQKVNRRLQFQL